MDTNTKEIDFNDFHVRCSAISGVLANSKSNPVLTEKQALRLVELRGKEGLSPKMLEELAELIVKEVNCSKVIISDTCISYLMTEYAWATEGMVPVTRELMDIPQMQKGVIVEPESLKLLTKVDGIFYNANENAEGERERIYNDFLSGEVDAYAGETIMTATVIPDIKSIWDYPTYLCKIHEPLTTNNDQQIKGYMDIVGCKDGFVANCLIDTPDFIIEGRKWQLLRKLNVATEEAPDFKRKWEIIERSMRFGNIPEHKRVFKKKVDPMSAIQQQFLYDRVKICREWLNIFHETFQEFNK